MKLTGSPAAIVLGADSRRNVSSSQVQAHRLASRPLLLALGAALSSGALYGLSCALSTAACARELSHYSLVRD